jgi:hypothetical protein
MSRPLGDFTKAGIKRLTEALEAAGIKIARIEYERGKVIFIPDSAPTEPASDLDQWIVKHARPS